jgi:hypothetical protein
MAEQEVPRVATPVSVPQLIEALRSAWAALFADYPKDESLELLCAHWAFETGWGKVGGWNWNLANRKHVTGDGREWFWMACGEILHGVSTMLVPPNPGCRFASFDTLAAGASDYLAMIHTTFWKSWEAVEAGDPHAFAEKLKAQGYYTDTEAHYEATLTSCLAMVRKVVAAVPLAPNPQGGALLALAKSLDAGAEGLPPDTDRDPG